MIKDMYASTYLAQIKAYRAFDGVRRDKLVSYSRISTIRLSFERDKGHQNKAYKSKLYIIMEY